MEFLAQQESDSEYTIYDAVTDGDLAKVQAFIEGSGGVLTPNSQDGFGYSPMHAAVSYGHVEVLKYLLGVGGSLEIRDVEGDLPLHYCEDLTMFKFLLSLGANPTEVNSSGETLFDKLLEEAQEGEEGPVAIINYLVSIGVGKDAPKFSFSAQEGESGGFEEGEEDA